MLAHWVETGSWWQSADARAVIGSDDTGDVEDGARAPVTRPGDGPATCWGSVSSGGSRRELGWRGRRPATSRGGGVFDLSFDWSDGTWQLVGCLD